MPKASRREPFRADRTPSSPDSTGLLNPPMKSRWGARNFSFAS
jgi:hypothetical protein